ncbi:MAG: c-type cytochrome [Rhodoferax sp.]|nr:c-type cytochrome [Rhodoferax sp.]MBP7491389.1 c-type cytochrome [Rhodoferax sp.]
MKRTLFAFVAAASLAVPALADQALATKNNCMACHSVDKKLVGPSFKEIAKKYTGQKDAETLLISKVMKGGSGVWGAIPMPANSQLKEADAKTLVTWVLALK